MKSDIQKNQLRKIYVDILHGFSYVKDKKLGDLYLKHLDLFESHEMDEKNESYTNQALKEGLCSEKDRRKEIVDSGDWDPKKDNEIEANLAFIKNLEATKSKMFLQSEIKKLTEEIKKIRDQTNTLVSEKDELMGLTAETYASKKLNDFYIFFTLYKDKDLKTKRFDAEEFDELSESEVITIVTIYNENLKRFSEPVLKRIALSGFFLNNFTLCKDNPFTFYGKPVVDLTFHQTDLFSFGRYFKHILSEMKNPPTPEEMDDPEKLMDKFNIAKNSGHAMSKATNKEGAASTIVGATKEDLKALGLADGDKTGEVVDLNKEAAKKGGSLSMQDLMKLHGI